MSRGFRDNDPDVELQGRVDGTTPGAYKFWPDFGPDEMLFIPKTQADWVPDPDSTTGAGTMLVRAWLANKNGWQNA
jgi:hypothetical protein